MIASCSHTNALRSGGLSLGRRRWRFNGREIMTENNPAYAFHCAEDGDYARIEAAETGASSWTYNLPIASHFPHGAVPPPFFYLSMLGIILSLLIYAPLLIRHLRESRSRGARGDLLSILGLLLCGFRDATAFWL